MGIYIPGIETPKGHNCVTITIWPSGAASYGLFDRDGILRDFKGIKVVSVPPHGDLIERDGIEWIEEEFEERCHNDRWTVVEKIAYKAQVDKLPTIIQAEEGNGDVE